MSAEDISSGSNTASNQSGIISTFVLNYRAHTELDRSLEGYINEQKEKKTLTRNHGVVEPGTSGCVIMTTYDKLVAKKLADTLRDLRKNDPGVSYRQSYFRLDGKRFRSKRNGNRGGGRGRGRGNNRSLSRSRSNNWADDDFSDTNSVSSRVSNSSARSYKSTGSNSSHRSFNLEGARDRQFAVYVDGKGISKDEWVNATPPEGGRFNWWPSPNGKLVRAYINFKSDDARKRWYASHHFIEAGGTNRRVIFVR